MASSQPMLCGSIAGRPGVFGVAMHTAAFQALGLNAVYVAFGTEDTAGAVAAMRALGIRGLGVTTPHKLRVAACVDGIDGAAAAIGAVNTLVNDDGRITGYNVDWIGAQRAIGEAIDVSGRAFAVIGAGGGARAIVHGLRQAGARVTLYNRTAASGEAVAAALGASFGGPPQALAAAERCYDGLCHATPVGFHDAAAQLLPGEALTAALRPGAVVFDAVAMPPRTALLAAASARGFRTVAGVRMQLHQAAAQFALYTGRTPDLAVMERALAQALARIAGEGDER
ncbi:MAG: shikimate dehydrogenase [Rhodospirillales bacterium]|nr:shikimate dehydrogenase [Rhodospirillales bacterium]